MFSGIEGRTVKSHEEEYYRGIPCLYHKHSGVDGTAYSWRKSDTHACMECVDDVKSGHFSFDLEQLTPLAKRYALNFWTSVDIESVDNCWRWTGKISKNRRLFYTWPRREIFPSFKHHPMRVVNWLSRGDIGLTGVKSLCGERRCCNPLHQIPDFMDDSGISVDDFSNMREYLLDQIKKATSPVYSTNNYDVALHAKLEIAYPQALKHYDRMSVRQTIK